MKKVWELFPQLTEAVRRDHQSRNCGHHPFEHALMVAQYCLIIANDSETGEIAAIAALMHNTDRLFPRDSIEETTDRLQNYLNKSDINLCEETQHTIIDAVLNHHKKNDASDSEVLACLKDADRLANISPFDIIARCARANPNLPLVNADFVLDVDPESTYTEPKTVFRNAIHSTLEWETWFRYPKAKELARRYFDGLRIVQTLTQQQLQETSLCEYKA